MGRGYNCTNVDMNSDFSQGRFRFVCLLIEHRKAKDYTYLYGSSLDDAESALTRHLKTAFAAGCEEYGFLTRNLCTKI